MKDDSMFEGSGFFNDDGSEINPDLVPVPPLCLTCSKNGKQGEEYVLCTLNRADQADADEFKCGAYEPLS